MATGWGRDYEPENRTDISVTRDRIADSKTNPTPENTDLIITEIPVNRALESDEFVLDSILRQELDDWMGVPYVLGGLSMRGVDCSGLVQRVFANALNVQTPRTTKELLSYGKRVNRSSLRYGDLVFFEPRSSIRHVGIYLSDGVFALNADTLDDAIKAGGNVKSSFETARDNDKAGPNGYKGENPVVASGNGGSDIYWVAAEFLDELRPTGWPKGD